MLKSHPSTLRNHLRTAVLAAACAALFGFASQAMADDYSEVGRLLRGGQLVEANAKVDQLLSAKPNDPQIRFFKGVILSEQGKPSEAISVFNKLTQDYPELPEPYNNLAVLYASQSQFDKARAALEMAIRTNPSYATAHENLGDVYAKLASQAYSKALQLDTSNSGLQPKLGLIKELFAPGSKAVRTAAAKQPNVTVVAPTAAPAVVAVKPVAVASKPTVATTTPVVKPTVAVVSKTEPKIEPVVAGSDEREAVADAVRAWARAWAAKDMSAYYAAYGSEFKPADGISRSAWEAQRKDRIMGKRSIAVNVSNIRVNINGDKATANFRQDYRGDALKVSSSKALALSKSGGKWAIVREMSGS